MIRCYHFNRFFVGLEHLDWQCSETKGSVVGDTVFVTVCLKFSNDHLSVETDLFSS